MITKLLSHVHGHCYFFPPIYYPCHLTSPVTRWPRVLNMNVLTVSSELCATDEFIK